jgi:phosphoribosylaminoimidazole-succinocarboxamide synthase
VNALRSTRDLGLEPSRSGKVRDLFDLGDRLLLVATDRISAYDVILDPPIPGKGTVLTRMSLEWFRLLADIVPNHLVSTERRDFPPPFRQIEPLAGRSMLVRKARRIDAECIVRGYLSGSGWKEYKQSGAVCGIELPEGLQESDKLPEPIFTPATKAELGEHDENIDFDRAAALIGDRPLMEELRRVSIEIYRRAAEHAAERGIILADTKFEFGSAPGAEVVLADEVLTPDSSRFWPADDYEPGRSQASFDKQYVRDYSDSVGWDHAPPGPELPGEVVRNTRAKYVEAYERITGRVI